jgi:hypothetical protein
MPTHATLSQERSAQVAAPVVDGRVGHGRPETPLALWALREVAKV